MICSKFGPLDLRPPSALLEDSNFHYIIWTNKITKSARSRSRNPSIYHLSLEDQLKEMQENGDLPQDHCHAPLPKIWNTGTWRWPADTHEEWHLFHEYLRLLKMNRIAQIYAYITKSRDKFTYMKYRIIINIIHHIWIREVKKKN